MDESSSVDRRQTPRLHSIHLVAYEQQEGEASGTQVEIGRTLDVSEKGVRFETTAALEPGTPLDLQIAVGELLVHAKGQVVHCQKSGERWEAGVEITDIAPDDRSALAEAVATAN